MVSGDKGHWQASPMKATKRRPARTTSQPPIWSSPTVTQLSPGGRRDWPVQDSRREATVFGRLSIITIGE